MPSHRPGLQTTRAGREAGHQGWDFHKNLFVGLLFDFAGVVLDQFPLV